ncbi:nuclear transport factor 2 family protein [Sphingosinithalassobacter portus]|uniref:nuclear transport factor 2 family protein n=1 Tax=Stakelama portus TaxID=2676234 RepID=UPI0011AB411F|nr:nuclear transport factor 2 family protein [Sphingosinithalassobacter portus]
MNRTDMEAFAASWIANWNARDLDAILAHFAEDAHFISPLAAEVTGSPVIKGKADLSAYWSRALEASTDLHFTLIAAICDVEAQLLGVHYIARRNGKARRALETMRFVDDRQVEGESFYSAQAAPFAETPDAPR